MILKKKTKNKNNKFSINKFLLFYFILTLVVGSISFGIIIKSLSFNKTKSILLDKISRYGRYEYIYLPKIAYSSLKSIFVKFEKINLDIKFEDIIILEKIRKESLKKGDLPQRDLIPKINLDLVVNQIKYRGKARLKGDRKIHYEDRDNTSYKIELKKDQYLFGMRKFSLQKPIIRNYIHEWIFHELAEDFGLIKINYEFIDLSINGEDKGLYVLEEGFGKELIERNKRRNGPIFGINEDLNYTNIEPVLEIYNKKYWEKLENKSIALSASQKLRDFFQNKIKAEEVFDLEKWASYFAIVDLTGTWHGALLKSVKFYYNPINGLFEPIPFDGHRFKPNFHKFNFNYDNKLLIDFLNNLNAQDEKIGLGWLKNYFFDGEKLSQGFYNMYLDKLTEISSNKFIEKFLLSNNEKINKINSKIYADSFWYHDQSSGMGLYYFSIKDFKYQAENIRNKLSKKESFQILQKNQSTFIIKDYSENYNKNFVNKFICNDGVDTIEIPINLQLGNFDDTIISVPQLSKKINCTHVELLQNFDEKTILKKINHINSTYDTKKFKKAKALKYEKYFYKKDDKLFLIKDEVVIENDLYIPKNFKVLIKPNQKIILINNSFIISNSPWIIKEGKDKVIISGKLNNFGGGILITDTNETSIIQNVKFSNLTGFQKNSSSEFLIYGAMNFHSTKVEIENVQFENIYSEDALNIFNSNFYISKTKFKNINSDAVDIDFSNGKIELSNFENIKNDGIDFSGSDATVYDIKFTNINDKVISVGEKSNIQISKINAHDSFAGIVSKDGSKVFSEDIIFNRVKIPFAAYQKKLEYGYGSLIVKKYDIKNFHTKWLKDKKSNIVADNNILDISTKKILSIINNKELHLIN
ncbi:CotH kinase family protein [Candidatus Pelagibacter sp. Uisw_130]|uniref:CotH kinase family protein n=1 Tax=Candidatus Pelagibacter sp. Uisw_130 TaxID=3230989 RepID=UPI0039E97EE3